MNWEEAVESMVQETGHERYRTLCADSHPHREIWRSRMIAQATSTTPRVVTAPPVTQRRALDAPRPLVRPAGGCGCGGGPGSPPAPSLFTQGMTAAAAAGRWIASGLKLTSAEVQAERTAICDDCVELDRERGRCKICKCFISMKVRLPAEACPLSKWGTEA